jgi:outer membrane protein TolC
MKNCKDQITKIKSQITNSRNRHKTKEVASSESRVASFKTQEYEIPNSNKTNSKLRNCIPAKAGIFFDREFSLQFATCNLQPEELRNLGTQELRNSETSSIVNLQSLISNLLPVLCSLFFVLFAGTANAQDSLSAYLELAGKNNPGLQAKYLEYSAALEKIPQAGALPDPTAELGFFLKPMELMEGNQVGEIRLMQMFPWFGTLKAAKDEASQMAVMKFEEARESRNQLYRQVETVWYRVYQKKKEIGILEENLELLRTLEKVALSEYTNTKSYGSAGSMPAGNATSPASGQAKPEGMSGMQNMTSNQPAPAASSAMNMGGGSGAMKQQGPGMVNVLRVQMEIAGLENQIATAKDLLETEVARFNSLLNRSPKTVVSVPDSLDVADWPLNLDTLSDSIENNPMLRMTLAEKAAGEAQQTMASKMGKPMLGLGVNYMLIEKQTGNTAMMNGNDMVMPMVSVSIPFLSKKYKAMKREAGFRIEASEKSYSNIRNELQVAFLETIRQFRDADRRLALYQKQADLARASVHLLTAAFSASDTDFEEVLRMQVQLLDYSLEELNALIDRNTAVAQIEYLTGLKKTDNR